MTRLSGAAVYDIFAARDSSERAAAENREMALKGVVAAFHLDRIVHGFREVCQDKGSGPFNGMTKGERHETTNRVCKKLKGVIREAVYEDAREARRAC